MLKGEKVILRALQEADFDAWYAMQTDVPNRLLSSARWAPTSVEQARERWQNQLHGSPDVRVEFAIEANDEFIGTIAIKEIERQSQHGWLGIQLVGDKQNRGYGQDAMRIILRWAFEIHNLHRVSLDTWATNERALAAYRAVGFREEGRMREAKWLNGQFVDVIMMGVLRHEWRMGDGG